MDDFWKMGDGRKAFVLVIWVVIVKRNIMADVNGKVMIVRIIVKNNSLI